MRAEDVLKGVDIFFKKPRYFHASVYRNNVEDLIYTALHLFWFATCSLADVQILAVNPPVHRDLIVRSFLGPLPLLRFSSLVWLFQGTLTDEMREQ